MPVIRVFLADDHPMILAGVRALLEAEPDIDVVGEAGDGRTALAQAKALQPRVAVLDVSMPGLNGIEVVSGLAANCPGCRCIVLTVHEERAYLRQALDAGAAGYLLKRSASGELIRAIRAVAQGGIYLDPGVAVHAIASAAAHSDVAALDTASLTTLEAEILQLSAQWHSNKAIADRLGIAVKTVEGHKAQATGKLGFSSRVELMRFALRQGWLDQG